MRATRWVRPVLLLVILACCCYGLAAEWPQVHPALSQLRWYFVAGSLAAAMAGSACMMMAWRALLGDLGSRLPVPAAARVTFVAQLGKYLPGAIWSFAAHVELGHDYQVPRRRGAASVIVALAVSLAVGLMIAATALPLSSPDVLRRYLPALALVPVIAVCLVPPVLHRILNSALRIVRQEPLEHPLSWRGLGVALAWNVLGWLLYGTQVWLLLADVAKDGPHSLLLAVGAYALAFSLALVLVVFPGGIGARELLLVAALAPLLAHGPALAVALVTRLVTTASDLTWGAIGVALRRAASVAGLAGQRQAATASGRVVGRHRKARPAPPAPDAAEPGALPPVPEAAA
jgi:uncharacterized membrane protein YbhN (UPF0104 family)